MEAITRWRESAEEEASTQLTEVNAEEARLSEGIKALERQIEALEVLRTQIRERNGKLDGEEIARSYGAVVQALQEDRDLTAERGRIVAQRIEEDRNKAETLLQDAELARSIDEFERFREMEAGLGSLPSSYRRAILDHHQQVKRRLAPVLKLINGPADPVDADTRGIAIIASVDLVEDNPESLVLVLPVDADIYNHWEDGGEDLSALLAFRMVAAAAELATRAGVPAAPISYRSFEGKLTVQVWFGSEKVTGDVKELAAEILDQVRFDASELGVAMLELYTLWLPPEVLNPPEDTIDKSDEAGEEARPDSEGTSDPDTFEEDLFGESAAPEKP
ncbi:MAG TPA: hypothetical protein QGF58_16290 [Myxococcota bacterium]|nr:hypothetical protein [Myxococcota bacterium]